MKKILCLLLTASMMFTFAACGSDDTGTTPSADDQQTVNENTPTDGQDEDLNADDSTDADKDAEEEDKEAGAKDDEKKDDVKKPESSKPQTSGQDSSSKPSSSKPSNSKPSGSKPSSSKGDSASETKKPTSALNLLSTVWKSYKESEKFPAAGGDYSEENAREDAPGKFSTSDSGALSSTLAVPEDSADLISSAASLTHMMNLNTFTAGSFKTKSTGDADKLAAAMKESIENRKWVCGFPEKMAVITIDKYVVAVYGAADLVDTFKTKLQKAYTGAKVYCEGNIE